MSHGGIAVGRSIRTGEIVAVPLATDTSEGSARAVNSAGWVVGEDLSASSMPFLYDGKNTYRLADLIRPNSGWDLSMNTSSSADGISDDGVIVGTGVHNGETHAYAMVPLTASPTPTPTPTVRSGQLQLLRQELLLHQGRVRRRARDRRELLKLSRQACRLHGALAGGTAATTSKDRHCRTPRKKLVSICVQLGLQRRSTLAPLITLS